jgi:hypothetical protein
MVWIKTSYRRWMILWCCIFLSAAGKAEGFRVEKEAREDLRRENRGKFEGDNGR